MPAPPATDPRSRLLRRAIEAQGSAGVQPSLLVTTLAGQDTLYGAPGQVPEYDWQMALPVPPRRRANALLTHLDGPLHTLTLLGQDQVYASPGQAPGYDWPLPGRKGSRHENRTWLDGGLSDVLLGQDVVYGTPGQAPVYDWQTAVPPKGAAPHRSNRTWLYDEPLRSLLGQDQVYGAAGQAPSYDWQLQPPPPGRPPHRSNRTWLDGGVLDVLLGQDAFYGAPGQVPARDLAEGVPKGHRYGPRFAVALRTLLESRVLTTLLGQDRLYGDPGQVPPYDWPLPSQMARPRDLGRRRYDVAPSVLALVLTTPEEPIPYGKAELPQPAALLLARALAARLIALRAQGEVAADLLVGVLLGQDRLYGEPGQVPGYAWSVPAGQAPHRGNRTHLDSRVVTTLLGQDQVYGAAGQAPVYEWVVPRGAAPHRANRSHLLSLIASTLLGQDTLYGAAGEAPRYEWLVPPGPVPSRSNRTHLLSLLATTLLGQDQVYGAPGQAPTYPWPLPGVVRRPSGLLVPDPQAAALALLLEAAVGGLPVGQAALSAAVALLRATALRGARPWLAGTDQDVLAQLLFFLIGRARATSAALHGAHGASLAVGSASGSAAEVYGVHAHTTPVGAAAGTSSGLHGARGTDAPVD